MINIDCDADIQRSPGGYRKVIIEFKFPGCQCITRVETSWLDTPLNDDDLLYQEMEKIDFALQQNPHCRHCLHNMHHPMGSA